MAAALCAPLFFIGMERGDCVGAGKPKKFKSGKELISLFSDFCDDIVANDFQTIPTQTAFCRWLAKNYESVDRKTIYNSLEKYFPNIKKDFEILQSDTIMQGGMLGKYQPTMSIFGLKNWCGWADVRSNDTTGEKVTVIIDV